MNILLAIALALLLTQASHAATLFVAPDGSDESPGTEEKPFATLERARDAMRALKAAGPLPAGGITVEVSGGVYELAKPIELSDRDSGEQGAPIVYRARPGQVVRITGGRIVKGWTKVTDPGALGRLDEAARDKVWQADLKAQGIADFGEMGGGFGKGGGPGIELFFDDRPMTLARWPNEGFVKIAAVLGPTPVDIRGTKGCQEGIFAYEGDRPRRWLGEKNAWLLGYWFWDWAEERQKIQAIDPEARTITLNPPHHGYGYRKGQWFHAFNVLSELDSPGEWYLDRAAGLLVFWPPSTSGVAVVSVAPSLLRLSNASHIEFRGFVFEACRKTAIEVVGGAHNRIAGCVIRNTGDFGVTLSGTKSGVSGCDIYGTGNGGISLSGGDRKTLAAGGLYAENNHIHHYSRWNRMYRPAVAVHGVGQRVAHNLIHDAPHIAIAFGGNDHVIEFNEIHDVCLESNDAGAMYAGRNWAMRGTVIRHNYLHDIQGFEGRGAVGVYLDDQFCGTEIVGNVFHKVTRAAMIGGGRDCAIRNNVFVDCVPATHVDARGLGWAASGFEGLKKGLLDMPYTEPPWSARYPALVSMLEDEPMAPKGNVIERNICVGGRWGEFEAKAKPFVLFRDNLLDEDPLFVNAPGRDFRLRDDSPAFRLGFQPIPMERIGLQPTADRVALPQPDRGGEPSGPSSTGAQP
jgi:hypothetical protein